MSAAIVALLLVAGPGATRADAPAEARLILSFLGLTPGESTLRDAIAILGKAPVTALVPASGDRSICYVDSVRQPSVVIVIGSEMDPDGLISSIKVSSRPSSTRGCVASGRVSRRARFSNGIVLGMKLKEVREILGDPSVTNGREMRWEESYRVPLSPEERAYLSGYRGEESVQRYPYRDGIAEVRVVFDGAGVTEIAVRRLETM